MMVNIADDGKDDESAYASSSGHDEDPNGTTSESESEDESSSASDDEAHEQAPQNIDIDFDHLVGTAVDVHGLLTDQAAVDRIWETGAREEVDMEEDSTNFDIRDELRKLTGIGKRKGASKRRRNAPVLSQQVKSILGDATTAYVERDFEKAIAVLQEVIQIEPRHAQAWDMLADVHNELGDLDRGLQFKILAAHLRPDPNEWMRLANASLERGHLQQALYCYKKAYQLDPDNVDAMWERAQLSKSLGDLRGARGAFLSILEKFPHDLSVLFELQHIIVSLGDIDTGIRLFEAAMEHYIQTYPSGHVTDHLGADVPGGGFGVGAVVTLADFYNVAGNYERAIIVIRTGMRWLQGRVEQRFWDSVPDDREFDVEGMPNRPDIEGAQVGGFPLSLNARHRLAIARLKLGDVEEAKAHAGVILDSDIREWATLYCEIADAYFEQRLFEDALPIYERLTENEETSSIEAVMRIGACRRNLGSLKEAAEVYQHLLAQMPDYKEAKLKLAEVYELMGELRKALDLVYQVIDARRRAPKAVADDQAVYASASPTAAEGLALFDERPAEKTTRKTKAKQSNRLDAAQLEDIAKRKQSEVVDAWRRLQELAPMMQERAPEAEMQWLVEAETLTERYREARDLFTTTKDAYAGSWRKRQDNQDNQGADVERMENDLATRLQLEIEGAKTRRGRGYDPEKDVTYRDISFEDWLTLFLDYAFLRTRRGQYQMADEVLCHVAVSRPFSDQRSQDALHLGMLACAIYDQKFDTVMNVCRRFFHTYQFQSDAFNILTASLASGYQQADAFQDARLQKHLSREVRLMNAVIGQDAKVGKRNGRFVLLTGKDSKEDKDDLNLGDVVVERAISRPDKENPAAWAVYAHTFLPAKSYQTATFYLMHAFELNPRDPVVCLSLAIACVGRAMQRQADNRHHMIVQAMAFMTKYKTLRGDANREEVDYNMGRAFHQLSLFSEALQLYKRVLASVEKRQITNPDADVGLARVTAYNMSLIYTQTGAIQLAQDLYRRWLSI